jgi:hypothetical protein
VRYIILHVQTWKWLLQVLVQWSKLCGEVCGRWCVSAVNGILCCKYWSCSAGVPVPVVRERMIFDTHCLKTMNHHRWLPWLLIVILCCCGSSVLLLLWFKFLCCCLWHYHSILLYCTLVDLDSWVYVTMTCVKQVMLLKLVVIKTHVQTPLAPAAGYVHGKIH